MGGWDQIIHFLLMDFPTEQIVFQRVRWLCAIFAEKQNRNGETYIQGEDFVALGSMCWLDERWVRLSWFSSPSQTIKWWSIFWANFMNVVSKWGIPTFAFYWLKEKILKTMKRGFVWKCYQSKGILWPTQMVHSIIFGMNYNRSGFRNPKYIFRT